MPTYEYECLKNGHRFERFQSMTDPLVKKCPVCGGKVKRLIGAGAGVLFKGSGFYITDYRSPEYHSKVKAEKGETGKSEGKEGAAAGESGKGAGASEGSKKPDAGKAKGASAEKKGPKPKK